MLSKRSFLALSIVVLFAANVFADTFEFVVFTPPPGWTNKPTDKGTTYNRPTGIGLIYFYNSNATSGTPNDEFAKMWNERITGSAPGAPPQPQLERDGDYTAAVGTKVVNADGTITTIVLTTIVGRGRSLGILTITAGEDVLKEVTTFLDSIKIGASAPAATTGDSIDVDFTPPAGYTSQRDGRAIVLKPTTLDAKTPCVYGISPSRVSSGNLERDARAAILEPLAGWQVKGEHYNARRGTTASGWPYYWFRTDVQQMSNGTMQYLTAMSMAFSGPAGKTNIVWGFGPTQHCTLDDVAFLRLFHSLKPRGFVSDGGKAFKEQLVGTWRNTEAVGMAQYIFTTSGNYEYGQGTSTTFSTLETRTGSVGDGKYSLNGSEMTLTGRRAGRLFVRIYEEFSGGLWLKTLSLLTDSSLEVRYMRVKD
ncbi:MAG TPA: hypothetical protein VJV05_10475 [Pyrinomonadaceae bacterium]|nr:hypothetical protein [Pyrinomonadaceae bacterium]